ncbi:MAG: hypothetical protein WC421_09775 [Elusimicrobiales bacterium]
MKNITHLTLAILVCAAPARCAESAKTSRASGAKSAISLIKMPDSGNPSVKAGEGKAARTVEFHEGSGGWSFMIGGGGCSAGPASQADADFYAEFNRPDEMGVFSVPGGKSVFVSAISGGTNATDTVLYAFNPDKCAAVAANIHRSGNETELSSATFTSNWKLPQMAAEREFLTKLMYEYGYADAAGAEANPSDPRYCWYLWQRDNGSAGKLKLRWFKGAPNYTVESQVKDGTIVYTAWFKSGVTAYDSVKKEFQPLYYPKDVYCWPTVLVRHGDYLIIGTNGEGIAFINLKTQTLSRDKKHGSAVVRSMKAGVGTVSVNDGEFTVTLPE